MSKTCGCALPIWCLFELIIGLKRECSIRDLSESGFLINIMKMFRRSINSEDTLESLLQLVKDSYVTNSDDKQYIMERLESELKSLDNVSIILDGLNKGTIDRIREQSLDQMALTKQLMKARSDRIISVVDNIGGRDKRSSHANMTSEYVANLDSLPILNE